MLKNDVFKIFDLWATALKKQEVSKVLKLYDDDATLLPTLSDKIRTNHREIANYFESFLAKKPVVEITDFFFKKISDEIITFSGNYDFTFENGDPDAHARFSFVYKKSGNDWKILEHHSSLQP
jgi:uncharacterized protein (TIGR02246 family)